MEKLLLIVIGILLIIIFVLTVKIYFLHKTTKEITEEFRDRLTADTNTLIDISSKDPYMRHLASEINIQLRLLRKEHHRYSQGDLELKEAVTNISHDLRTPLTAIKGYLSLLEQEDKNENTERYLSQIKNRTECLIKLTDELFQYSIVTSRQNLNFEKKDLVREVEGSLISFYALMREKNIEPQISLPQEPVWVYLDSNAINRILSNIINNAIKYSDGDLFVIMDNSGKIVFSNTAHNLNSVTVGKLFDRFYTVETSRNSTGLGLSIAKILTEKINGKISAEYKNDRLSITLEFDCIR